MSKFKSMFLVSLAAGILLSLSASANAQQWYPSDSQKWANNPCSDARISWGLWSETGGTSKPQGGIDCDPANYDFSQVHRPADMDNQISAYRRWQRSALTVSAVSIDRSGNRLQRVTDNRSGASMVFTVGRVVSQGGGNVVSQGGGNLLTSDGASIVSHDGGTVVSQGGGNARPTMAAGEKIIQLRGRWFKVR